MSSSVGSRLREERRKTGLSQEEFARLCGVGKNSQFEYESDKTAPNTNYLARIAEQGADAGYVLTGLRSPDSGDPMATELLQAFVTIGGGDRELLLAVARRLAGEHERHPTIHDKRTEFRASDRS